MNAIDVGLCAACAHGRVIESRRGSRYWLCGRSRTEPTFPRYPALPVLSCRGFDPAAHTAAGPEASEGTPR